MKIHRFFRQPAPQESGLVWLAVALSGGFSLIGGLFAAAARRWEAAILLPFALLMFGVAWSSRRRPEPEEASEPVRFTPGRPSR